MKKSMLPFLVGTLILSMLVLPDSTSFAQGITLPAQMNLDFSPLSISPGATSRLGVSIFNPNAFALTNASWTNNLISNQPGLVIANPVDIVNTCGGTVTAAPGATTFSLSNGIVPAQSGPTPGSCSVTITVTSSTIGNLISSIPAGALSSSGGGTNITNSDPASATLHVGGVLPPTVSKSFSSATIWAGEVTQLSIGITNHDPNANFTQASITDDLPANVLLANPASPVLSGCGSSASVTAANGGRSVTLNNGTVPPNSTCTITVNVTSSVQGAYTNIIPANALHTQQGLTNTTQAS